MSLKVINCDDGTKTIIDTDFNETYHSRLGSIDESKHVFIDNGIKFLNKNQISIFELGFGTGLNTLLTIDYCIEKNINLFYYSIDIKPIDSILINELDYIEHINNKFIYEEIINSDWSKNIEIFNNITLYKNNIDIKNLDIYQKFDIIYFDAFGKNYQEEMWQEDVISKCINLMDNNSLFVTYASNGNLKRILKKNEIKILNPHGAHNKREMTIGIKGNIM